MRNVKNSEVGKICVPCKLLTPEGCMQQMNFFLFIFFLVKMKREIIYFLWSFLVSYLAMNWFMNSFYEFHRLIWSLVDLCTIVDFFRALANWFFHLSRKFHLIYLTIQLSNPFRIWRIKVYESFRVLSPGNYTNFCVFNIFFFKKYFKLIE